MGIRIDFDIPTYLRVEHGLAAVSTRLDHLLPAAEPVLHRPQAEPVVINRLYRGLPVPMTEIESRLSELASEDLTSLTALEAPEGSRTTAEFIPHDEEVDNDSAEDIEDASASEISFRGREGVPFQGVYLGGRFAAYRFQKGNSRSYFIRLGKHLIWGMELRQAIARSGAQKGDLIEVTFTGKTPVKVLREAPKGTNGEAEWITSHRNSWDIQVLEKK